MSYFRLENENLEQEVYMTTLLYSAANAIWGTENS